MITGKEELLQSFIEAFIMEKATREFYNNAAEKAHDKEARNAFSSLAEWENKHMDYIQFLYQSVQGELDMKSFAEFSRTVHAPLTEGGMPVKDLMERIEGQQAMKDTAAITLALEIEGKAYNLYRQLSEKAEDRNARIFMKEMMEQELKHIDYLKAVRLRIAETA
ncbi:MAG: ferritin family protein [Nitrospirota bacterium]